MLNRDWRVFFAYFVLRLLVCLLGDNISLLAVLKGLNSSCVRGERKVSEDGYVFVAREKGERVL